MESYVQQFFFLARPEQEKEDVQLQQFYNFIDNIMLLPENARSLLCKCCLSFNLVYIICYRILRIETIQPYK